jgi:hypothetical protein
MWVRKTEQEKASDKKPSRFSPALPIAAGLFFGLVGVFYEQSLELFIPGIIFGFIITYVCQLIFGSRVAGDIIGAISSSGFGGSHSLDYFCPNCRGVQLYNPKGCPQCGSKLEKADDWKWEPEEDHSRET